MKDLAKNNVAAASRNLHHIPTFGRWDDLYLFVDTPLESKAFAFMKKQLALDVTCKTPSLLAKWLKSENTSSKESRILATKTREAFGMTSRQYRKTLSTLRERINVLERLMSARQWDKIEFDKIPSRAGLIYKNAFARHDIERAKAKVEVQTYAQFAKDTTTKVNAKALYPYDVVGKVIEKDREAGYSYWGSRGKNVALDDVDRLMINKYWDNLTDYFNGASLNALAIVDTSASMLSGCGSTTPMNIAVSLGLYCADKAKGPFAGHYISFSRNAKLVATEGVDFYDKVQRIYKSNICENTNLVSAFNLVLETAVRNGCKQEDLPDALIVISDMQIDSSCGYYNSNNIVTDMEVMRQKWGRYGYRMPKLIYWNVNASKDTILDRGSNVSYVSGASPVIFQQIMQNKSQIDLMMDKLNSERYARVS